METLLIITHEVQNFENWKKGFDQNAEMREKAGIKLKGIYQAVDNANMVTVITQAPNPEVAKALISNADLKATMEKAGIISKPEIKILNQFN